MIKVLSQGSRSQGFSLVATLVSIAILGIILSTMLSSLSFEKRAEQGINEKLELISLELAILRTLKNPHNCVCQFASHRIDKTKVTQGDYEIILEQFKHSCGGSLIKKANNGEGPDGVRRVTIESIKVSHIIETATANEYFGDLVVAYQAESLLSTSFKIPLQFTTYPNSGAIFMCGAADPDYEKLSKISEEFRIRSDDESITKRAQKIQDSLENYKRQAKVALEELLNPIKEEYKKTNNIYKRVEDHLSELKTFITENVDSIQGKIRSEKEEYLNKKYALLEAQQMYHYWNNQKRVIDTSKEQITTIIKRADLVILNISKILNTEIKEKVSASNSNAKKIKGQAEDLIALIENNEKYKYLKDKVDKAEKAITDAEKEENTAHNNLKKAQGIMTEFQESNREILSERVINLIGLFDSIEENMISDEVSNTEN